MIIQTLKELFIYQFNGGPIEVLAGVLTWFTALLILGLIIWGGFYLIDSMAFQRFIAEGYVTKKVPTPTHRTTTWMMLDKIIIPITTYHPDSWSITIEIPSVGNDSIKVDEKYYNEVKDNDRIWIEYSKGILSGTIYIKRLL